MKLSPQQVNTISKGDQEIAGYFHSLLAIIAEQEKRIQEQEKQIKKLETRVQDLERQLGQNSNNSSKPSSDGFRKPTNLRKPGGKKGAPKGHEGHTLRFTDKPDEIVIHSSSACSHCSASLETAPNQGYETSSI